MADDKVRELADELAFEFGKGWREGPHFALIIELRLKPLLDAISEGLCCIESHADLDTCDCRKVAPRLAAELRNWRKE